MTTVPATAGGPYEVSRSGRLIVLDRTSDSRRTRVLFAPDDALAVADALVDAAESITA